MSWRASARIRKQLLHAPAGKITSGTCSKGVSTMLTKRLILSGLSVIALSTILVHGQGTSGEISGTVKDPQGAAVAGATVMVTNLDTPFKRQVTTNADGYYRFVGLPVGRYEMRSEHQGFKTAVTTLKLTVAEEAVAN